MPDEKKLEGEFILHEEKPQETAHEVTKPVSSVEPSETPQSTDHATKMKKLVVPAKFEKNKNLHFFSSLVYKPEGMHFENQESQEEILLIVRRDFITNLPWILTAVGAALVPVLLLPFLSILVPFVDFSATTRILYTLFYYLALTGFVIVEFTLWYFHIGIVTSKKVIDVDVHGILTRDVASALIEDIEDVGYVQVGVIPSIFNYGNVNIQTAGEKREFEYDRVPDPSPIVQLIQNLMVIDREKEYE